MMQDEDDVPMTDAKQAPEFAPMTAVQIEESSFRSVPVPPHRFTPLKKHWEEIYAPLVEHMRMQVRFNPKRRCVEMKATQFSEQNALEKSADFVRAFMMGFEVRDAITLLRVDDMFIDSFEVKDVKNLQGEHLSRAIGRIAGQGGKTKFTIENATKTRIVIADTRIHLLGSFQNVKVAKTAICNLIMGSPSGKVYTQMRGVANRMKNRY